MKKTTTFTKTILAASIALALTGCGGGGGGGVNVQPDNDFVQPIVPVGNLPSGFTAHIDNGDSYNLSDNADQMGAGIWRDNGYTGSGVVIAVADSGFAPGHETDRNTTLEVNALMTTSNGNYVPTGDTHTHTAGNTHGDEMSQVIGSSEYGVAPGAELLNIVISDENGIASTANMFNAIDIAEQNNADIINLSFAPGSLYRVTDQNTYSTLYTNDPFLINAQQVLDRVDAKGMVVVHAAGNNINDLTISESNEGAVFNDWVKSDLKDNIVFVGASYTFGGDLAGWSGFAGTDTDVQDRFLIGPAQSTWEGGSTVGTSGAAANVSGGLALMMERWDHLTAAQATQIALDTANRTFDGYDVTQHGQGHFDLASAWSPQGKTTVPFESGSQASLKALHVSLPAGFKETSIQSAIVDSYNRDYMVNVPVKAASLPKKSKMASMGAMVKTSPSVSTVHKGLVSTFDATGIDNVNRDKNGLSFLGMGNGFDVANAEANSSTVSLDSKLGNANVSVAFAAPRSEGDNKGVMTQVSSNGFTVGAYANSRDNESAFYGANDLVNTGALIEYENDGMFLGMEANSQSSDGNGIVKNYAVNTNKAYLGATGAVGKVKLGVMGYVEDANAAIDVTTPVSNGDGSLSYVSKTLSSDGANSGVSLSASYEGLKASATSDNLDNVVHVGYSKNF